MQRVASVFAARNVRLRGEEAKSFLERTGWILTSDSRSFSFVGDFVRNRHFFVSRCRHSPGRFELTPLHHLDSEERLMVVLVTEGRLSVTARGVTRTVGPGQVLLVRPESIATSHSEETVACSSVILQGRDLVDHAIVAIGRPAPEYLALLLGVTNVLLSNPVSPSDAAFSRVERAVGELVGALTASTDLVFETPGNQRADQLYLAAVTLIASEATNPATTVETISRALRVSRSHLFRAFKNSTDSPSTYLRRIRVDNAMVYLKQGLTEGVSASRSGFGTVRRMRRAFAQLHAAPKQGSSP